MDTRQLIIIPTIIIRSPPPPLSSSLPFVLAAHRTKTTTKASGGSDTTALPLGGYKSKNIGNQCLPICIKIVNYLQSRDQCPHRWTSLCAHLSPLPHTMIDCLGFQILFITKLHSIVHKQWIYRNLVIHYCKKDGLTIREHHDIINWVEAHSLTHPDNLLPCHHYPMSTDFV